MYKVGLKKYMKKILNMYKANLKEYIEKKCGRPGSV